MRYQIILDEQILDSFIDFLPELGDDEVYYLSLMARCDNDELPSVKDGQIYGSKRLVKKKDIKRCLREFEVPIGTYQRKGVPIAQEFLSPYITINPRSLKKAAKVVAVKLTERLFNGETINPVEFSFTAIHKSIGTKHFVDFDFDLDNECNIEYTISEFKSRFKQFYILRTKGGIHMIVPCSLIGKNYSEILGIPGLDQHGSHGMIPIPGCTQRGFMPDFKAFSKKLD